MFFIMGISQGRKQLNFDQTVVCRSCGRYGHLEVYQVYSYLSLFFIPVFKWGYSYYVQTSCCDKRIPIDQTLGKELERRRIVSLPENIIPDTYWNNGRKRHCENCGFETDEDYQFCPKCGAHLD
ncbi:MAG: zinc ribbon domain-containing protein [Lachnospiraceae bacterium]|jgi:hypothetical protein|nr:zinc ribbon domain-containing protein [Lachnospiraceae bacterium]